MKRKDLLFNWLANRQRTYADGMELFRQMASEAMKQRYGNYLEQVTGRVSHPFDPHFTQLVNCLSRIAQNLRAGIVIAAAEEELDIRQITADEATKNEEAAKRTTRIQVLSQQNNELQLRISDLENDSDNHATEIDELSAQVESNLEEIGQLRKEVDALNAPGVKVVTEASLPKSLQQAYTRIKEIAPLYASLHNDIAQSDLPDDERRQLAEQLCDLDDERRKLWRKIDEWAEGKGKVELDTRRPEYSDNAVVRGYEIARQIKRLKENIKNSTSAAEKAQADGRQNVYDNAVRRIERYQQELKELEEELQHEQEG